MGAAKFSILESYAKLGPDDAEALTAIARSPQRIAAGAEIVAAGAGGGESRLLLSGQAFRYKTLADGRRQILGFQAKGDILDLQSLYAGLDFSVAALTACEVCVVTHPVLEALIAYRNGLSRAIWRYSLVDAAIAREWVVRMGRKSAYGRMAHLFCEVFVRLRAAGQVIGMRCPFPVTQSHIADALGLSEVHTNRVLQTLRAKGLLSHQRREFVVIDWAGLCEAGEFDPRYLQLPSDAPVAVAPGRPGFSASR